MKHLLNSLTIKIGALIILAEIAVLSVVGFVYTDEFANQVDKRIEAHARIPGTLLNTGLLKLDSVSDRKTMEQLVGGPLLEALIVGTNNNVFLSFNPDYIGLHIGDVPNIESSLFDTSKSEVKTIVGKGSVIIVSPIFASDGQTIRYFSYIKVGTLTAELEKAEIRQLFIIGSLIAVVLTSLVIMLAFRSLILTRVSGLLDVLTKVGGGDLNTRVEGVLSQDELGQLQERTNFTVTKFEETVNSLEKRLLDLKQAEAGLANERNLLRTLIDSLPDYIYVKDTESKFLMVNSALKQALASLSSTDIIGASDADFFPAELAAQHYSYEQALMQSGEAVIDKEEPGLDVEGNKRWLLTTKIPLKDSRGHVIGLVGSGRDITERKRIEEELHTQSQIISNMQEGAFLIRTSDETIAYNNPALEKMFGYKPGEMLGKHTSILNAPTELSPEEIASKINNELKANKIWRGEINNIKKDGTLFWSSATVSTINHPIYGEVWVAVQSDITEHKRNEELLRRAQKMEAVGQLTGGVAHDFNNLLGVILGNADLIKERLTADDHNYRRLIEPVIRAAERGAELTRSLLAFSRKQPLDPKVIDLNQHVNGMLSMLQRVLSETIDIETVHAGGLWSCLVDPGQVENALLNLAINARDAMPAGGKMTIETANTHLDDHYEATRAGPKSGQYVMLAVTDTGEGMTPEGVERAFEPFYTTKALGKGTGLGLSMVYGFAKQSNGHVTIYSEPGEGTTVKLYLPRSHDSVVAEVQSATAAILEVFEETVLVVEDDGAMRDLTVLILSEIGYQVLEADTGEAALTLLKQESHIDLLLSDVVIPGEPTGQALAREAIVHHANIKTIFMSGYTESAIIHQGRIDPGVVLLQKPFTKSQLALKIRKILDKP